MRVTGINANLAVADIAAARHFSTNYLGLDPEEFNLGWVPWGVRRFFVRAPDGNVINIVSHRDE